MSAPLLSLRGAAFRYHDRPVFEAVDLDLEPAQVVTVLGTNGSGKSTLLRCLGGALRLTSGSARLDGADLWRLDSAARARSIGILFQDHSPSLPFSVREIVLLGRTPHRSWIGRTRHEDEDAVTGAMEEAGVTHLADRPYTALSGGERHLVLLARTLAQQPRVILMDEPTAHLDLRNQVRCLHTIRSLASRGVAVVVTTHDPNHAFVLGDRAVLMKAGAPVVVGPVADVVNAATLHATYGIDIGIHEIPRRPGGDAASLTICSPW